jgi:hypothetical protein
MTGLTIIQRIYMPRIFTPGFGIIMTTFTTLSHASMIKNSILPGNGTMTIITVFTAFNMLNILSFCYGTIMTTLATAFNRKMINFRYRSPSTLLVTKGAFFGCWNM